MTQGIAENSGIFSDYNHRGGNCGSGNIRRKFSMQSACPNVYVFGCTIAGGGGSCSVCTTKPGELFNFLCKHSLMLKNFSVFVEFTEGQTDSNQRDIHVPTSLTYTDIHRHATRQEILKILIEWSERYDDKSGAPFIDLELLELLLNWPNADLLGTQQSFPFPSPSVWHPAALFSYANEGRLCCDPYGVQFWNKESRLMALL